MPELPEVETRRRYLDRHALGHVVARVHVPDAMLMDPAAARTLDRKLRGHAFDRTHRHGKWLFLRAGAGNWLVLHFGMTGNVHCIADAATPPKYVRLQADFANGGAFIFTDPRKFGEAHWCADPATFLAERGWGPDPLAPDFTAEAFRARLAGRTGVVKGLLLNQHIIAGVGNLYADEMLYQAALHPEARAGRLRPATCRTLYEAMRSVFEASLAVRCRYRQLPPHFLLQHREGDGLCPQCARPLEAIKVAGRTTRYCPRHQRRRT